MGAAIVIVIIAVLFSAFKGCTGKDQKVAEKDTTKVENLKVSVTKPSIKPNDSIVVIETSDQNTRIVFRIFETNNVDTVEKQDYLVKLKFKEPGIITAWTVDKESGNKSDTVSQEVYPQNVNLTAQPKGDEVEKRRAEKEDAQRKPKDAKQKGKKAENDADIAKKTKPAADKSLKEVAEKANKKTAEAQEELKRAEDELNNSKRP